MDKPNTENLQAKMRGYELNMHQKGDAIIEFNQLLEYVEHLEQQREKVKPDLNKLQRVSVYSDFGETYYHESDDGEYVRFEDVKTLLNPNKPEEKKEEQPKEFDCYIETQCIKNGKCKTHCGNDAYCPIIQPQDEYPFNCDKQTKCCCENPRTGLLSDCCDIHNTDPRPCCLTSEQDQPKEQIEEKEWSQEKVQKCFDELGFEFPENEDQLKAFEEKFKDYPHKLTGNEIDPYKILESIKHQTP